MRVRIYITLGLIVAALAVTIAAAAPTPPAKTPAKAPAAGTPVELKPGKKVPDFTLKDANGKSYTLSALVKDGNVVVLEWFNYGCPFVKKYRSPSTFMNDTAAAYKGKKVVWLAISSSAVGAEGGDPAEAAKFAAENNMTVPLLWDQDGKVGHAFGAKTTPHMFVINAKRELVYVGAPDTSTGIDKEPKGDNLIKAAVDAALAGKAPKVASTTPHGCSVKYAKADAPAAPAAKPAKPAKTKGN